MSHHPSNNNYPWNGHEYQQTQENNQESYQRSNPNGYYYNQGLGLLQQSSDIHNNTFHIQPMTMQPPTGNPFQFAVNNSNNTQAQLPSTANPFYFENNSSNIHAQVPPPPMPGNTYNSMAVQQNQQVCPPPPPFPPVQVYPPPPPPVFSTSENLLPPPPPLPKKKKSQQKVKQPQTRSKKKKKKANPAPLPPPPVVNLTNESKLPPAPHPSKKKKRKRARGSLPASPALLPRPAPPARPYELHSVDESKLPPPPKFYDTNIIHNEINASSISNEEYDKKEPIHNDSTQANISQNDMDMDISDDSDHESSHELTHSEEKADNDTNVEQELQNRKEFLKLKRKQVKLQKIQAKLDEAKIKREIALKKNSRHESDEIAVKEEEHVSALEQKRLRLEEMKAKLHEAKMKREVVLKSSNNESTDKTEQKKIRLEAMKAKLNEAKLRKAEGLKRKNPNEVEQAEFDELEKKRLKLEQMRARLLWKKEQASRQSSDAGSEPDLSTFAENVQEDESIMQQETNCIADEKESNLPDITAFSMTSLVISNISASGETELVRPRAIESINILGPPRTSIGTNTSMELKVKEEPVAEIKTEDRSDVSRADKLKLELELAKRRLRLVELQRKRQKISETFEENESVTIKKESVSEGDKLSRPSIEELLKKRQKLSDNIQASKITQQKKKEEHTVRQLRTMIAKQEKLLNQHKDAIKLCIIGIQDCRTTIENEKAVKEKAELQLRDLQQRRENTEKMMKDVSNNVMKLRSKRS